MLGETRNGCINPRRKKEVLLSVEENLSPFSLLLFISIRVSHPFACPFVLLRGECFQESCGAYDYAAQTEFRMGKVFELTIHLAQPVRSLCLTWREEFARFPDNESGKLPAGSGRSLDT